LGKRISHKQENIRCKLRFEHMGIMLQANNLFNHLSVKENILFTTYTHNKENSVEIANNLISELDIKHCADSSVYKISSGEYARASLAVALSTSPKILFLDEPTSEVDKETEKVILKTLDRYKEGDGAIFVVTHSDIVAAYADKTIHIFDGKIIREQ